MKNNRFLIPLLLALLLAGSVYFMYDSRAQKDNEYKAVLAQARTYAENGVIADSISCYKDAIARRPSVALYLETGEVYLKAEDYQGAEQWYERNFTAQYPNEPETYEYGLEVSLAKENYREAFEVYDECQAREVTSKKIEEIMDGIRYQYDLSGRFYEVRPFAVNGMAAVKSEETWGYIGTDGSDKIPYLYTSANVFGEVAAVVDKEGNAFYIDSEGNKKITASYFNDSIIEFRPIQSDLILAYDGSVWNYYDVQSYKKLFGGYADATLITYNVGAVTQDGTSWALIDSTGKEITGYDYEGVAIDGKGILCRTAGLFVRQDDQYWLVDVTGQKISKTGYDDARAFLEDSWAAVSKKGHWIFVNAAGEEKDLGDFEEAKSFSNGFAAVKKDGLWGFIDEDGNTAIDCVFEDVMEFYQPGVTFVKPEEANWQRLALYSYFHS